MHRNNCSDSLDVNSKRSENNYTEDAFSISISTPGKVILFGEHSVVYGKLAIAASLGLRTKLSLKEDPPTEIGNSKVTINLLAVNLMHCYDLEDLQTNFLKRNSHLLKNITIDKPELATHENFAEVIETFIERNSGSIPLTLMQSQALFALFYLMLVMIGPSNVTLKAFTLDVGSDFSVSSGLGSSASYMVSLSACFYEYVKFKGAKLEKKKNNVRSFSKKDLDLICRWAYNAERIVHGTPSGLDNTICTLGSLVEFRKNSHLKPLELKSKIQILLVNSKIPKDTKAQVAKVAALKQNYPSVIDNILTALENVSGLALQEILKLQELSTSSKLSIEQYRGKTNEIYRNLDNLVDFNQNLLRTMKVSHPFLDEICVILAEVGLHGKLTGGGGGGYVFSIIPTSFDMEILKGVMEKLTCVGYETILTDIGGPGLSFS